MTRQLHLRIPDEMQSGLQKYADARGITIAAAVRIILHQALEKNPAASDS